MGTEMHTRLQEMLLGYEASRARLAALSAELAVLTATARSTDRSVIATVNPQGELVSLSIDPVLGPRLDPKALAARIIEASGVAAAEVRQRLRDSLRSSLPATLRDLVGPDGAVDVRRLLPEDPHDLLRGGRR